MRIVMYSDKEPRGEEIVPEEMPLRIEYEDPEVLIINKPPGLVVHPASGNYSGTLINGVAWYLQQKYGAISEQNLPRFGLVHRIDKNTSGLMVLAVTRNSRPEPGPPILRPHGPPPVYWPSYGATWPPIAATHHRPCRPAPALPETIRRLPGRRTWQGSHHPL